MKTEKHFELTELTIHLDKLDIQKMIGIRDAIQRFGDKQSITRDVVGTVLSFINRCLDESK